MAKKFNDFFQDLILLEHGYWWLRDMNPERVQTMATAAFFANTNNLIKNYTETRCTLAVDFGSTKNVCNMAVEFGSTKTVCNMAVGVQYGSVQYGSGDCI